MFYGVQENMLLMNKQMENLNRKKKRKKSLDGFNIKMARRERAGEPEDR